MNAQQCIFFTSSNFLGTGEIHLKRTALAEHLCLTGLRPLHRSLKRQLPCSSYNISHYHNMASPLFLVPKTKKTPNLFQSYKASPHRGKDTNSATKYFYVSHVSSVILAYH